MNTPIKKLVLKYRLKKTALANRVFRGMMITGSLGMGAYFLFAASLLVDDLYYFFHA